MASTLRKMFSIGYFQQSNTDQRDDESVGKKRRRSNADASTSQITRSQETNAVSVKTASEPVKYIQNHPFEILNASPQEQSKKLRLEEDNPYANLVIEHTPKKISLGLSRHDFCGFRYSESMEDIFHYDSSKSNDSEIESLSDTSTQLEKSSIPMCRKVTRADKMRRSISAEDFSDIESDRNEDQRVSLLLTYQRNIENVDRCIRRLLTEFQFHIEVSKIFSSKSLTDLPGSEVSKLPKEIRCAVSRAVSPSWNIVAEKEDTQSKLKLRDQLLRIKDFIQEFADTCLHTSDILDVPANSTMTEPKIHPISNPAGKKMRINRRKHERGMNDFPDLREVLQNLFSLDGDRSMSASVSANNVTDLISDFESSRCNCRCAEHESTKSADSGLAKPDEKSDTISSSIGDFTLDNSQLTAYSESLEQVVSYNSFDDSSLMVTMLQKSAIERITFYVQVHGIQMTTKHQHDEPEEAQHDESNEPRNILFGCPSCQFHTPDERGLLQHILSRVHCEKVHFLYKTAYIKRCFASGEEIKPSTVLNSMTMYRDDNKIVCFGDSKFACSLCFENGIVGESVLIAHCNGSEHVEKRNRLDEVLDDASDFVA